jgi:NhaP-type Na+/H+ or K+/H+ antiporter
MDSSLLVLALSAVVLLSYLFNLISRKTRIPSVLWLLGTGIAINYFDKTNFLSVNFASKLVEVFGIVGLIMIILEAALDLHVDKGKGMLILRAFLSALVILFLSTFSIAYLLNYWLDEPLKVCLIYAATLSIVSSAIVIPSIDFLSEAKKEFIVYEASFSDILGILFFNYLIGGDAGDPSSAILYIGQMGLAVIVSIGVAIVLVYLLGKVKIEAKFFLTFAVLIALYVGGKILHLPSLLIILFFGLIINNKQILRPKKLVKLISPDEGTFGELQKELKSITAETSFLVRTFFFLLFGYSIDLNKLTEPDVLFIGSIIVVILLAIRLMYLKYLNPKESPLPELFLMPRGLITILLFYNIPDQYRLQDFNNGILFFVILVTSFLMMFGLFSVGKEVTDDVERQDGYY